MRDDSTAFVEFASARTGPLFRTALLLCGDWHLADDHAPEGQRCGPTLDTCDSQVLPDGSELTTFEQHVAGPSWGSVPMVLRGAVVRRPDGLLVAVSEINTVNQEGHWSARPTRSNLPISTDQLAAIAQSPLWQKTVPISIAEAGQRLDPFWLQPGTGASTPP